METNWSFIFTESGTFVQIKSLRSFLNMNLRWDISKLEWATLPPQSLNYQHYHTFYCVSVWNYVHDIYFEINNHSFDYFNFLFFHNNSTTNVRGQARYTKTGKTDHLLHRSTTGSRKSQLSVSWEFSLASSLCSVSTA